MNTIKILGSDNVTRQALRETMARVAEGHLRVRIDRTLLLAAAAEAHTLVEQHRVVGRIVLVPEHD